MEPLIETLRNTGLTDIHLHTNNGTVVVEASYHVNDLFVSKYLIFPLELEQIQAISESGVAFDRFEDEHVAPFYFRLRGDWTWNLYVVYVLSDETFDQLSTDRKLRIESGKRYGRKLVVSRSKVMHVLPVAKLPMKHRSILKSDPYSDWFNALKDVGLSFCLEPYSGKNLSDYIRGIIPPVQPPDPETSNDDLTSSIMVRRSSISIDSLNFGTQFRPHCWQPDTTLDFARINLLEGSNGTGKTSVLEAIELAFTGRVLRNEMSGRDGAEPWDGSLKLSVGDKEQLFITIPDVKEQKARQSRFYRQRERERIRNTQLNQLFHQYNYFSSEAVYRFCYGDKPNYRQAFARVVFGEEMGLFEERWKKYRDEFVKELKPLRDRVFEKESELEILQSQIRELQERVTLRVKMAIPLLKQLLSHTFMSYPFVGEQADGREIENWLEKLYMYASEVDVIGQPLKEVGDLKISTFGQIDAEKARLKQEIAELEVKMADAQSGKDGLPQKSEIQSRLYESEQTVIGLNSRIVHLSRLADEFDKLKLLFIDNSNRRVRVELEQETEVLQQRVALLGQVERHWGHLGSFGFEHEHKEAVEKKLNITKEKLDFVQSQLQQLSIRIQEEEEKADSTQKLIAQIKSLGLQYVQEHTDRGVCPMCGTDHRTAERLVSLMEAGVQNEETHLRRLREEEQGLMHEQGKLVVELDRLKTELECFIKLNKALVYINENAADLGIDKILENAPVKQIQGELNEISHRLKQAENRLGELQQEARRLDESGFTIANIRKLERLIGTLEVEEIVSTNMTAEQIQASLAKVINDLEKERRITEEQIEKLKLELQHTKESLDEMERLQLSVERDMNEKQRRLQQLSKIQSAARTLRERGIFWRSEDKIGVWQDYLSKLLNEIRLLLDTLQENEQMAKDQAEKEQKEASLADIRAQWQRCQHAVETLNGLLPLSEYIDEFVETNISAISDLFVRLHSPQEFDRLELRENELVANRRSRQGESLVGINQMSTGQRTAVILSIFFVMHLSLETVPNFILLDEPVANLDDLNVLALLDFLRQLTLTRGTQIVFTTANPTVASLFRRKFSIFEDRFRAFHFSRVDRQGIRIQVETYLPFKEEGVPIAN